MADTAGLPQMAMFISHNDAAAPSTTGKICCLTCVSHPAVCLSSSVLSCLPASFCVLWQATLNKLQVLCATRGKWQAKIRRKEKESKAKHEAGSARYRILVSLYVRFALHWPGLSLCPFISLSLPLSPSLSPFLAVLLLRRQFYLAIYNCRDVVAAIAVAIAVAAAVVATSPLSSVVGAPR